MTTQSHIHDSARQYEELKLDDYDIHNSDKRDDDNTYSFLEIEDTLMVDEMESKELTIALDEMLEAEEVPLFFDDMQNDKEEFKTYEQLPAFECSDDLDDLSAVSCQESIYGVPVSNAAISGGTSQSPIMAAQQSRQSPLTTTYEQHKRLEVPERGVSPECYKAALSNFELSMKRTELSRAQIFNQSNLMQPMVHQDGMISSSMLNRFAALINGKTTTLTTGLEQSRMMMTQYLSQMNNASL